MPRMITSAAFVVGLLFLLAIVVQQSRADAAVQSGNDGEQPLSLITANAEEGFALAITLSRKAVTEMQPDTEVLHAARPAYAHDPEALIDASHVVAVHFQTVAAANDYWRD